MKNIKRKIIYSLIGASLISSSAASAAPVNWTSYNSNQTYNTYGRGYTINYKYNYNYNNSNIEQNNVINQYPVWNWTIVNTRPSTRPGTVIETPKAPEAPAPTVPTKPAPTVPTKPAPTVPTNPDPAKPVTPAPTAPSVSGLSAIEAEVVRLVNIERQKEGLQPFVASAELSNVARKKSEDMAINNYFSHTSPTYGSPFDMMKQFGISYRTAGENIARGQLTAQSVVNGWMNSPGHRANIMNPSFNKIGVGHFKSSNGTNYWTQMFTN